MVLTSGSDSDGHNITTTTLSTGRQSLQSIAPVADLLSRSDRVLKELGVNLTVPNM